MKKQTQQECVVILSKSVYHQLWDYIDYDCSTKTSKIGDILIFKHLSVVYDEFFVITLENYNKAYKDLEINLNQ